MQLEFWFKDPVLAKTEIRPPILIVFTGGYGFYGDDQVAEYSKLQEDGTYLWTAFVDQAAKVHRKIPVISQST